MTKNVDPRVKLIIIFCISTLGLIFEKIYMLLFVFFIGLIISYLLKANFLSVIKKVRKVLYLFVGIIIIQSLFIKTGKVIIGFGNIRLLTDQGLQRGLGYFMRVLIIMLSGTIISTCNMRKLTQGLVQMKLPYEIAFMTSIGIKFLPLLIDEIKDTVTAIQLKGIDINKLPLKQRIEIISYIFTPIIVGTLNKAKKLSFSVECRGFRTFDTRTSIVTLQLTAVDYLLILSSIALTSMLLVLNAKIF